MEERSIFRSYLRACLRPVGAFLLLAAIAGAVLWLYDVSAEAVLYAAGLTALTGAGLFAGGYVRFRRRRMEHLAALAALPVSAGDLPEAATPGEEDFRAMAARMKQAYDQMVYDTAQARQEHLDWYTAWVHQIKTPIAVMQMTLQAEDTPEHRALAAELFRIRQYADMALSYLRLDQNASDLVIRSVALDGVIRQAIRKYAPRFVAKRLALDYGGTDVQVLTDEKWLLFILEQLLDNAVKYTMTGGVTITVSEEKVLSIADTGIGIDPADLPRIFEKGFTGFNGRTDKSATGLGLYLCRRAAGMLHHRLWAASAPGRGSVFCLDLHSDPLEVE